MNLQTLVRGINGIIPGGLSLKDFSMATKTNEESAQEIINNFIQNGIGRYEDDQIYFEESDKLKTSVLVINMGAAIDEVSRLLSWQDFESLAAEILEKRDFETSRNVILTKPKMQIDVIGIKSEIAVLIDCKHWSIMTQSSLQSAVKKQIERTKHFVSKERVKGAIPVIVTLYQHNLQFIDNVPIIPIHQLDSFCEEFYGNLEKLQS